MSLSAQLDAGQRIDSYRIVRHLGGGGFAAIYEAVDERNGNHVVLKVPDITTLGDPQVYERFRREVEITKRLDHPNIQRNLDTGGQHTQPYLVLEFIDGVPLRTHLHGRLPLDPDEAIGYAVQLARALAHAHGNGVAHRDLKPENVLVTADGQLKLIDFGIALLSGARRVTWRWVNDAVGTPDYMSPEQIQGKRGDERSDIYALGTMLYEMLAGSVPYSGDNPLAVMQQVVHEPPVPLSKRNPRVSPALAAVVHRAMRKDPAERYANAQDMLFDLEHLDQVDPAEYNAVPERMPKVRRPLSDREIILGSALVAALFIIISGAIILAVMLTTHH